MNHYPIEIFWDEEDHAYIAIAPDLPGCSAGGNTEEAALRELKIAMRLWLDAAKDMGREIPVPSEQAPLRMTAG
jgi:predicted RNase H-like HicB family nuclease